jgi:hypothetical protein
MSTIARSSLARATARFFWLARSSARLDARHRRRVCTLLLLVLSLAGCSELRARSHARDGNELYKRGEYAAALDEYERSERLYDRLPVVALNKGLTCRQLIVPGSRSAESQRAAACALSAFKRLATLRPDDPRGEQLYVQTLFDADRYDELAAMYEAQLRKRPDDMLAINGLIQVYTRSDRPEQALRWTIARADQHRSDADAQYAVGVAIYYELLQKGGGPDKSSYDPRSAASDTPARPNDPAEKAGNASRKSDAQAAKVADPARPLFGVSDIVGQRRLSLADQGIGYLERALAVRPSHREALVYLNLLYRQRSFALFDQPGEWQKAVDAAESYRSRALALEAAARAAAK